MPLITIFFRFAFANLRGYFNCWSEKNMENTLKAFIYQNKFNITNKDLGGLECNMTKHSIYIYI